PLNFKKYRVPSGTVLAAGGFLVIYEGQYSSGPSGFILDAAHGGEVWFSAADAAGELTGERRRAQFDTALKGVSFGRYSTSVSVDYPPLSALTFGQDAATTVAQFRTGV